METIKVNMTPNPLDVQTIHASQNDGEARQWGFELHNNGDVIDSSEVTDQITFKAYEGGTEEILPTNGSTPTTSPFKGDIKYPQGLLSDQEFTYRESPTESDGLAKITDIKGNTLVWNQQITDPNFTDVSKWRLNGNYTSAIANNELTLTVVSIDTNAFIESGNLPIIPNGHKFFFRMMVNPSVGTQLRVGYAGIVIGNPIISAPQNTWTEYKAIVTSTTSTTRNTLFYFNTQGSLSGAGATIKFKQATLIDLTQMFGSGNEPTSVSDFTSLFSKPYYDYCQGAMLSFGGKNVKFNQLVQNGNFVDTSNWYARDNAVLTVSNNVGTLTTTSATISAIVCRFSYIQNHKYLIKVSAKSSSGQTLGVGITNNNGTLRNPWMNINATSSWQDYYVIGTATEAPSGDVAYDGLVIRNNNATAQTVELKNVQVFDLTEMFGQGCEPSAQGFFEIFKSDYYAYTTGKYMNLGQPVSLKTVSKNQFDTSVVTTSYAGLTLTTSNGTIRAVYSGGSQFAGFNFYGSPVFTDTFLKGRYRLSFDVSGLDTQWTVGLRQGASFLGGGQALAISNDGHYSFTIDTEANPNCYLSFARTGNKTTAYDVTFSNIQLELGTTETSYEPYASSTLSLPISTYFSNGMKSAGSVYDEWTPNKATPRVGEVTFDGTQTVAGSNFSSTQCRMFIEVPNVKPFNPSTSGDVDNGIISSYLQSTSNDATFSGAKGIHRRINGSSQICVSLGADGYASGITTETLFNQYLASHPLTVYYELATESETTFTTASLVTENGEIPLSNEDGVLIGKCTEQLSADAGFIEGKIKLSDEDGDVYSNKIQIHVERSPQ